MCVYMSIDVSAVLFPLSLFSYLCPIPLGNCTNLVANYWDSTSSQVTDVDSRIRAKVRQI